MTMTTMMMMMMTTMMMMMTTTMMMTTMMMTRKRPCRPRASTNSKKRKRSTIESSTPNAEGPSANKRNRSGTGQRFRRVKEEEALAGFKGKQRELDNSYAGTYGDGGWGAKASDILIKTRGKSFRHEKTKKKRGTYRGGKIDFKVMSIKLD